MTLLLVDDNEMVLTTRRMIFERLGYRVLTAKNGADALSMAREEPIQVAIVDYHLPDIDGDILCAKLKAEYPNLRVILASGLFPESLSDCPDYVVVKGGSPMELVNKVASFREAA